MIVKDEDWRDRTYFPSTLGTSWADWGVVVPLFVPGVVGIFLSEARGYVLFGAVGTISLYIDIILCFTEKEYVSPSRGPLGRFTD